MPKVPCNSQILSICTPQDRLNTHAIRSLITAVHPCTKVTREHLKRTLPGRRASVMPEMLVPLGMMAGAAMGEWLTSRRSGAAARL